MSLQIKCTKCNETFWIKGYSIPTNSWDEPGEDVVSEDKDTFDECCEHIQKEDCYEIIDSEDDDHGYYD